MEITMRFRFLALLAVASLPAFASAFERAPLVFLGDVPADVPVTTALLPHWLQVVMMVLGGVVPVFSFIAALLNSYVRAARARGETVPTWVLAITGAVNVPALNPDKTVEAVKVANAQAEAPQVPVPAGVPTMTQAELFAAIRSSTGVPHPLDPEGKS